MEMGFGERMFGWVFLVRGGWEKMGLRFGHEKWRRRMRWLEDLGRMGVAVVVVVVLRRRGKVGD